MITVLPAADRRAEQDLPPRRWPVVLALALVTALLAGAAYVIWFSPVLALRTVTVIGADTELTAQVRTAVTESLGTPLASIDLAAVRGRVAQLDSVDTVSVTRTWPHELVVSVVERVPVASTQANGQWWLIAEDGTPYRPTAVQPAGLMPIALATPGRGDRASAAALTVLKSLQGLPPAVLASVVAIAARSDYEVELRLSDGRTVLWGSTIDDARKVQVLPAVLARPGTVFDITDPTLVSVR